MSASFVIKAAVLAAATATILGSFAADYDSNSASDKANFIWGKVISTSKSSGSWPSTLGMLGLFTESMSPTVEYFSDEFPSGRKKLIHSVGAIAQCKFEWNNDAVSALGYTGLFKKASYGTIRGASAVEPDYTKSASDANFIPGFGFKFHRTGVHSGNFVAMNRLFAWDSFNIFSKPISNHLSGDNLPLAQQALAKKFATVSDWAVFVGLSDFAKYTEDGVAEPVPKFPYQLVFTPNPTLAAKYPNTFVKDLRQVFVEDVKAGTALYTIFAIPNPKPDGSMEKAVEIGKVITTSDFVTSSYADTTLFLKHTLFEDDLALRPDWAHLCPKLGVCANCITTGPCNKASSDSQLSKAKTIPEIILSWF